MKKRDFETYQKRFRDFEILPKFSDTYVFRGTIRHPSKCHLLSSLAQANLFEILTVATESAIDSWPGMRK